MEILTHQAKESIEATAPRGGQLGERPDYEQWAAALVEAVESRPSAVRDHPPLRRGHHLFVRLRRA